MVRRESLSRPTLPSRPTCRVSCAPSNHENGSSPLPMRGRGRLTASQKPAARACARRSGFTLKGRQDVWATTSLTSAARPNSAMLPQRLDRFPGCLRLPSRYPKLALRAQTVAAPPSGSLTQPGNRPSMSRASKRVGRAESRVEPQESRVPFGMSRTPLGVSRTPLGVSRTPLGVSRTPLGMSRTPLGVSRTPLGVSRLPFGVPHVVLTPRREVGFPPDGRWSTLMTTCFPCRTRASRHRGREERGWRGHVRRTSRQRRQEAPPFTWVHLPNAMPASRRGCRP